LLAVVLEAPEVLRVDDRPLPVPGPGEVLVDIGMTGICGTDVSIYAGKVAVRHPLIMGHEMFGRVSSSAPLSRYDPGTRVIVDPVISCGSCYWCSKGQANLCPNGALLGRDRDGGFTEAAAVPVSNLFAVPDAISDEVAPLLQVLTVCTHGQRNAPLFPGDSALIIGLGVSGLLHLQIAKARGAKPLIGITRSAPKRELALQLGADLALDPAEDDLGDRVRDATAGRGPDLVIECAGKMETLAQAIELVRFGGHVTLFGTITDDEGALPFYSLYLKEITLTNPRAAKPEDFPAALELVSSGAVRLEPLVTHTFPLGSTQEAIDTARSGRAIKVTLDHGSDRT
jgi:2-desacetyl-2-hydroxyethyl bacteriochlorophyllide A dehydrogenase